MPKKLMVLSYALLCNLIFFAVFPTAAEGQGTVAAPGAGSVSVASWTPFAELAASRSESASEFGQSVSVSGNVGVIGSWGDSNSTGAAYVFVKSSGTLANVPQTARLTASDGQPGNVFGYSVSISGNTIVVGALGVPGSPGKAYIFVEPPTGWTDTTETAQLTASDGQANDQFGTSVGISGSTVVAGAPFHTVGSNSSDGAAYVFVQPRGGWTNMTQTAELTASDGAAKNFLGYADSISNDTVAAGASGAGAVYVFVKPASGWANTTETAKLTDPKDTGVGYSVAISGNTVVSGSPSGGPRQAGAAHVYVKQGSTWKTTSKNETLRTSDGLPGDQVGFSVATNGDTVLAGAPKAPCGGSNCRRVGPGVVYTFEKPTSGWTSMTQTQELTPSDGKSGGSFGESVAASGPAVLIGATGTNTAYVYQYAANSGFTVFSVPGSTSTSANGINNVGKIVGNSNLGTGFLLANGVFTTIAYPGAMSTAAEGINDGSEVVGVYTDSLNLVHGFTELNGVYTSIEYPGASGTYFTGLNNLGEIVGNYCCNSANQLLGFLYSNGVFTNIFVPGSQDTNVFGINDSEAITGAYCDAPCTAGSVSGSFVYSNGTFMPVSFPGALGTTVSGIDNNNDLTGNWSGSNPGQGGAFAFWEQSHQFMSFSLGGPDDTSANGVNISGEIVGDFCPGNNLPCYGFYGHLPGH
jgi:FG-GAP repeat